MTQQPQGRWMDGGKTWVEGQMRGDPVYDSLLGKDDELRDKLENTVSRSEAVRVAIMALIGGLILGFIIGFLVR